MMRQSPPELFTQRPVRSEFGRREPVINLRRVFMLIALLGTAVLIGIAVQSFMKDETPPGEVPTIQADEGEVKVRPENPGGLEVPHQDVQVFQQLEKSAPTPADDGVEHLLPPPETPEPSAMTQPAPAAETPAQPAAQPAPAAPVKAAEELPPPITTAEPPKTTEKLIENAKPVAEAKKEAASPVAAAPVATPAAKEEPKKEEVKKEEPKKAEPVKKAESKKPAPVKTVAKKPAEDKVDAAMSRLPAELFTTGEVPAAQPAAAAPVKSETPASGKTLRLQLASFPEESSAQASVQKLSSQYAGSLGGARLEVVRVDLGAKGIYYRVMSQALPETTAKEICTELSRQKAACLLAH